MCLICLILNRFTIAVLHLPVMCCTIFNCELSRAPKYLIQPLHLTSTSFAFMLLVVHFCNCHVGPKKRLTQFLSCSIFNWFTSIQVLMLSKHDSSFCILGSSILLSVHSALNLPFDPMIICLSIGCQELDISLQQWYWHTTKIKWAEHSLP